MEKGIYFTHFLGSVLTSTLKTSQTDTQPGQGPKVKASIALCFVFKSLLLLFILTVMVF